jgi:hypothetical protein
LPSHLVLEDKSFEEPSGNRALDAEETGSLIVRVRNEGLGPAKLSVRLTPLAPMDHLQFSRTQEAGFLAVGESRRIAIPIGADSQVEDGTREIRVEVTDAYTRASIPFALAFDTRALVPPEFRVIVRSYDDGRFYAGNRPDGQVQAGEVVQVLANVQNTGGDAEGVTVDVSTTGGPDVRFWRDLKGATDSRFLLGRLGFGNNRDIGFYFYTIPVMDAPKVNLVLQVTEATQRYTASDTLSFEIGKSVTTDAVLNVAALPKANQDVALVQTDLVDVDAVPANSRKPLESGIAVVFGVEEYRYAFPAAYKARDATTFYRYCRSVLGIPEERIALRLDEQATKAEFDYIFGPREGWLRKHLRNPEEAARADVVVYLAGHGFPDLTNGSPYLIPSDVRPEQATNGVSLEALYQVLGSLGARTVTVFVESCFSGTSGYDKAGLGRPLALNMNPVLPIMEKLLIPPNMVVFAATSGRAPSSNRDDLKHGIFTYFLLKGFGGAADNDGDRRVTVAELFRYLEREVPRKALEPPLDREQLPELLPSPDQLGDRAQRVLVEYGP